MENSLEIDSGKSRNTGVATIGRDDLSEVDETESEARGDSRQDRGLSKEPQSQHLRFDTSGYFTRSKGRVPPHSECDLPSRSTDYLETRLMESQHKMFEEIKFGFQNLSQEIVRTMQSAFQQSNQQTGTNGDRSRAVKTRTSRNVSGVAVSTADESSDESDDQSTQADDVQGVQTSPSSVNRRSYGYQKSCKLPPFTGKESWKVWFGRFEEVACRRRWSDDEKLDELLPRLQGTAGEFVFNQLLPRTRGNYSKLTTELNSRFQIIELPKTFKTKLARRVQKHGESVEDFAADLKMLYDKAFPERSYKIRAEDLLRYFLDGLTDDEARQQVEFVKEPTSIDEAVVEVVIFQESKRKIDGERSLCDKGKRSKSINMVKPADGEDDDEDDASETEDSAASKIARMNTRPGNRGKFINKQSHATVHDGANDISLAKIQESLTQIKGEMATAEQFLELQGEMKDLNARVTVLEDKANRGTNSYRSRARRPNFQASDNLQNDRQMGGANGFHCFTCGSPDHFARNCPNAPWLNGQMNMAGQPNYGVQSKPELSAGSRCNVSAPGQVNSQVKLPSGGTKDEQQLNSTGSTL